MKKPRIKVRLRRKISEFSAERFRWPSAISKRPLIRQMIGLNSRVTNAQTDFAPVPSGRGFSIHGVQIYSPNPRRFRMPFQTLSEMASRSSMMLGRGLINAQP